LNFKNRGKDGILFWNKSVRHWLFVPDLLSICHEPMTRDPTSVLEKRSSHQTHHCEHFRSRKWRRHIFSIKQYL